MDCPGIEMAEIQKDTYAEATYTNELVEETDTKASFKVTVILTPLTLIR